TRPVMMGRSGSPPRKSTSTSCPMRGRLDPPYPLPPQGWVAWIQHELVSSYLPSRSQWDCTRTRPNSSVWISSPWGPTTVALSTPLALGLGVSTSGRYERSALIAVQAIDHLPSCAPENAAERTRSFLPGER